MAERAILFVLQKLADPLIRESLLLYGVSDEVEWLQAELRWMECFLIDAGAKRRRGNKLISNWLREVREVAHQAEDIIDTFTLEIIDSNKTQRSGLGLLRCIERYAAFPCEVKSRYKIGTEIEGLRAKIDRIKESRERYGLVNLAETTVPLAADEALQARRRIYPHLDDNTLVVGLGAHQKEIAYRLLNPNIKRRCVVSIVGIGGIGKTTLANKVYNNIEIKASFDVFACLSVSQDYRVLEIYKEIVKQTMGKSKAELQSYDVDELGEMLREFLMRRRYLIVLDDVWGKDVWDQLIRAALPEGNNGSRVLLTTRLVDLVASIDPTIPPYELPFLNEDESWALFLNKAFPYKEFSEPNRCPEELEGVGRRLVKRCGGLPLALEVLGGILSSKKPNSVAWTSVAEHLDWGSTDNRGDCYKILWISYDNLPDHHLKSCFLYLGVFPEDSLIEAQQLIELWIAEGLIPQLETQLMEDTAHAYLEELAQRSMIQIVDKDWLGSSTSVSTLRIQDPFRDLCIREAREDDFFNIYNTNSSTNSLQDTIKNLGKSLRRLVVHGDISTAEIVKDFLPLRNLRSILQFGTTDETPAIIIPNGLKLLRVIHSDGMDNLYEKFPEMFSNMIMNMRHLRYLRLSGQSKIRYFPPSIRNLCNLQTLDLAGNIVPLLPDWLGEIRTLRHLYLYNWDSYVVSCPPDIGSLPNLQTLDVSINASGGWIERGLEKLVNVRVLKVVHLGEDQGQVFIASLRKMKYLSSLEVGGVIPIEFFSGLSEHTHLRTLQLWGPMSVRQLPESHGFGFPPNLTTLILHKPELVKDPMETLEKFPKLRVLQLHYKSYIGKEMVCTAGGFPHLHELMLRDLTELEEWRVEDGAMPSLTVLNINQCRKLTLPEGLQHLHSLRTLNLYGYSKDRVQRDVGEDWYKIQHVPDLQVN